MRVAARLGQAQYRRDAGLPAGEALRPLVPGRGPERPGERGPQRGPAGPVTVAGQPLGPVEAEHLKGIREELSLDRPDRHVAAVGALVYVVVGTTGVQEVVAALVHPAVDRLQTEHQSEQRRRAVDDAGV